VLRANTPKNRAYYSTIYSNIWQVLVIMAITYNQTKKEVERLFPQTADVG